MNTIQPLEITPESRERMASSLAALEDLAARYKQDPALRARIDSGDIGDSLTGLGVSLPSGIGAKIVANTMDTFHVVLPPNPNMELSEEMLNAVGGGCTSGSIGTVGTMAGSTVLSTGQGCVGTDGSAC